MSRAELTSSLAFTRDDHGELLPLYRDAALAAGWIPPPDNEPIDPGIDETARDHDADALADLGDVGDLDQYDRTETL